MGGIVMIIAHYSSVIVNIQGIISSIFPLVSFEGRLYEPDKRENRFRSEQYTTVV
jgi:hypothetical protein